MEWVRAQKSPWGQEILIGLSWDLFWVAVVAGGVLISGHLAMKLLIRRKAGENVAAALLKRLPARILRHTLPSRLFHWTMASSMVILVGTAFLPILGIKFSWVTTHWITGWVLTAAIVFHICHTTFFKGLGLMWITKGDWRLAWRTVKHIAQTDAPEPGKSGKIALENKLFHHAVALSGLATIATGLAMMAKVDTPWWNRNPFLLSDGVWGLVYVIHGIGSVTLVTLIMVHVYFAVRPEKAWITLSMFRGWISRENYLAHHDPELWQAVPAGAGKQAGGGKEQAE